MSREMGFYLMVPGACIYLILLCLVFYFPVLQAMNAQLTTDDAIFYSFLFFVFYPISMGLMLYGNRGLHVFSKWMRPLSLLPFLVSALLCVFF